MDFTLPQIPDVPTPYDDELLGSWITRTVMRCGLGAWIPAVRECGFTSTEWSSTDFSRPNERYLRLLGALGTTYIEVCSERTTLPFWLFTEASPTFLVVDGETIPQRQSAPGRTRMARHFRRQSLWYCPECVVEDFAVRSEAYWRRSHQLPTALVCHTHGRLLRSRCHLCERRIGSPVGQLLDMPHLVCRCGAMMASAVDPEIPGVEALVNLAKFSAATLKGGIPRWNYKHVRHHANELVRSRFDGDLNRNAWDIVCRHFGLPHPRWNVFVRGKELQPTASLILGAPDPGEPLITLKGLFDTWRAVGLTCLFSALGESVDSLGATLEAIAQDRGVRATVLGDTSAESVRLDLAKKRLLAIKEQKPDLRASSIAGVKSYIVVSCLDPAWLVEVLGLRRDSLKLVGVYDDRVELLKRGAVVRSKHSKAVYRARLRDSEWYQQHFGNDSPGPKRGALKIPLGFTDRKHWLEECIRACEEQAERPARITLKAMATVAGVSPLALKLHLAEEPELLAKVELLNSTYKERRIRWKLGAMAKSGERLASWTLLRELGLSASGPIELLRKICAEREEWSRMVEFN